MSDGILDDIIEGLVDGVVSLFDRDGRRKPRRRGRIRRSFSRRPR